MVGLGKMDGDEIAMCLGNGGCIVVTVAGDEVELKIGRAA